MLTTLLIETTPNPAVPVSLTSPITVILHAGVAPVLMADTANPFGSEPVITALVTVILPPFTACTADFAPTALNSPL